MSRELARWFIAVSCLFVLSVGVTLPARAQIGDSNGSAGSFGTFDPPTQTGRGLVTDPYEGAMKLMAQGNYGDALKILKAIAANVPDSQVALLQIGFCYLNLAKSAPNADAAQHDVDIGAGWILHAGNVGLRDAQEELVQLYLDGKIFFADPPEAGKWYFLWKQNRSDVAFGIADFNHTLEKRLKLMLSPADWTEAENRAKETIEASYSSALPSTGKR